MESLIGRRRVNGMSAVARVLALIVSFNTLFVLWLAVRPGSHGLIVGVDNIAQSLGPLLTFPLCLPLLRLHRGDAAATRAGLHWWAPVLLGSGPLLYALGQMIYTTYEVVFHYAATPVPSWSDPFFLLAYPCMLVGILWTPSRKLAPAVRARFVLDALTLMTGFVTFSWYFILGPTIIQGADSVLGQIVGTAYPLGDLVLIFCLLFLTMHSTDPVLGRIVGVLWVAFGVIIVTDSIYDYQVLHATYGTGHIVPDVGWPLGYMLVGLAAFMASKRLASTAPMPAYPDIGVLPASQASVWRALLPYLLIPVLGILVFYAQQQKGDPRLDAGVYAGAAVLIGLLLIRQVLALLENNQLFISLKQTYDQLEEHHQALEIANRRLSSLATTDALTGLPNHLAIVDALDREIERAHRYGRHCALLIMDLDYFKALNDGYGHQTGDVVLREFASVARSSLRGVDILGRWGGEEFMAILPETSREAALTAAEHVRESIAAFSFAAGGGSHLTCSVGVAIYRLDGDDRDAIIAAADLAMYAAKSLGRNQVRCAGDPAVEALTTEAPRNAREDASLMGTVEALAALVQARGSAEGPAEGTLFPDVSHYAMQLALMSGLSAAEARMVGMAGRVYDIGKVGVPDAILRKRGALSKDEWATVRKHPVVGEGVLGRVPELRALAPLVRSHHERWDGRGYPDKLRSEAIPLGARIIAVASAYHAITTRRPYREAHDAEWAMAELKRCAGSQFDPRVVEALEQLLSLEAERMRLQTG